MSVYFLKSRFVFCTKEEAKKIANEVNNLNEFYKDKADFNYSCDEYDEAKKGFMLSISKRNNFYDDFGYLDSEYKTYYTVYEDFIVDYYTGYTNDYNHEVFPKYIVNDKEFFNLDELKAAFVNNDNSTSDKSNPMTFNEEDFISWLYEINDSSDEDFFIDVFMNDNHDNFDHIRHESIYNIVFPQI